MVLRVTAVTEVIVSAPCTTHGVIILKTTGHKNSKHDWNRLASTGSTIEQVAFAFKTTLQTDWESFAEKFERQTAENSEMFTDVCEVPMWSRLSSSFVQ